MLAARYKDESAVLFDLLNEPHDPLLDDPFQIQLIADDGCVAGSNNGTVRPEDWVAWAARLVTEIRAVRPSDLILVGGMDWAYDLSSIRIDAPGILYSAHIYPARKQKTWWKALSGATALPVFIGEWGGSAGDLDFGRNLAAILREQGVGRTAWSWVDNPELVQLPRTPCFSTDPVRGIGARRTAEIARLHGRRTGSGQEP